MLTGVVRRPRAGGVQNVQMRSTVTTSLRLLIPLALAGTVLSGCGGSATPEPTATASTGLPTPSVDVPAGITLTEPGAELKFGAAARVAYEANAQRRTVLQLSVTGVTRGTIKDLSSYVLDSRVRASNPYYVKVTVKNIGTGNIGGSPIPLWAVDAENTLIQASGFTNRFARCPSTPLPKNFGPGRSVSTCLLYLVPDHGSLTGVSFRPLQAFAPIVWTGRITPAKRTRS